jgi:signal transduction histidine kinase
VEKLLRAIQQSAETSDRLARDLVDVTSIEAGHLALELRDEAPASLVALTETVFRATADERGITLDTRCESNLPAVRADAGRLLQGLGNLMINAIKWTESGGRITLSAERDPLGVRFCVEDTGAGLAAEDLPHVYDRYWQKHPGGGRGTGLGLTMVRGIVEAHGGKVAVSSAPEKGSRFSFTIPSA